MFTSIKLFKESLSDTYVPGDLSREEKIELLNDFKNWSGGFYPHQVDWEEGPKTIRNYFKYAIINPKDAAKNFIANIHNMDDKVENYMKESLDANGLSDQQREDLKGRFNAILEIQDFDFQLAEVDVYEEINNLPEHQRLEAEEIWEDVMTEHENGTSGYYESKKVNENVNGFLPFDQKFTVSIPLAYTVQNIIDEIYDHNEENIPKESIYAMLTPDLCQEFVDGMLTINDESIDDERHDAAVYEYIKNFTEELQL